MTINTVQSTPGRGQTRFDEVHALYVWKQAIHPKKWRENSPATKIALLFMA